MAHVDLLVGKTTKPAKCQLCREPIAIGELAGWYQVPPRGSVHFSCHVVRRRKAAP